MDTRLNRYRHLPLYQVILAETGDVLLETTKLQDCADFLNITRQGVRWAIKNKTIGKKGHIIKRVRSKTKLPRIACHLTNSNYVLYSVHDLEDNDKVVFEHYSVKECAEFMGVKRQSVYNSVTRGQRLKKRKYRVTSIPITVEERREFQKYEYARRIGITK